MAIITASITNTVIPVYTSTGDSVVTYLSLCNYTGSDISINFYVVPNGASANNSTIVYSNLLIPGGDTYQIYVGNEKLTLSNADSIQVSSNTVSGISAVTSYLAM